MTMTTETTVSIREVDADTAEDLGYDSTLRTTGRPLVEVVVETWFFVDGSKKFVRVDRQRITGSLMEARISPEHVQEV